MIVIKEKVNTVTLFKLITGEEIVGIVSQNSDHFITLKKVYMLAHGGTDTVLVPWLKGADTLLTLINIPNDKIMTRVIPSPEVTTMYYEKTNNVQ